MARSGACSLCGESLEPGDAGPVCAGCLFDAAIGPDEDPRPRAAVLPPGSRIGPFEIVRLLGTGGMAVVYEAYEEALERVVALKVLPQHFLHDDTFAARFTREARIAASLEHTNIVPIYSSGIHEGLPWMSMRLLTGGSLAGVLERGPLDFGRAVRILRDVAEALDYAHARGVIHRDVKPSNVLLDGAGRACLSDFGLAYLAEARERLSRSGTVAGTPFYMAPEHGLGIPLDHRSDLYSLGVVAYEILTGRVPFEQSSPVAVLMQHARAAVPVPPEQVVSGARFRVLQQSLSKFPEARWSSALEFVSALERAPGRRAAAAIVPFRGRLAAGMATVIAVGLGALMGLPSLRPNSDTLLPREGPNVVSNPQRPEQARISRSGGNPKGPRPPGGQNPEVTSGGDVPHDDSPTIFQTNEPVDPPQPAAPVGPRPVASKPEEPGSSGVLPLPEVATDTATRTIDVPSPSERPVEVQPDCSLLKVEFPRLAKQAKEQGRVILSADIDQEGRAHNVKVVVPRNELLNDAAVNALKDQGCKPGRRNGRADTFRDIKIHVDFVIER